MRLYKNIGKGAVVMLNSNEGHDMLEEVMRAAGVVYEWPDALATQKPAIALQRAGEYIGTYATTEGMVFTIALQDESLALQVAQQPPQPLLPASELEFFATAVNTTVRWRHLPWRKRRTRSGR